MPLTAPVAHICSYGTQEICFHQSQHPDPGGESQGRSSQGGAIVCVLNSQVSRVA